MTIFFGIMLAYNLVQFTFGLIIGGEAFMNNFTNPDYDGVNYSSIRFWGIPFIVVLITFLILGGSKKEILLLWNGQT